MKKLLILSLSMIFSLLMFSQKMEKYKEKFTFERTKTYIFPQLDNDYGWQEVNGAFKDRTGKKHYVKFNVGVSIEIIDAAAPYKYKIMIQNLLDKKIHFYGQVYAKNEYSGNWELSGRHVNLTLHRETGQFYWFTCDNRKKQIKLVLRYSVDYIEEGVRKQHIYSNGDTKFTL